MACKRDGILIHEHFVTDGTVGGDAILQAMSIGFLTVPYEISARLEKSSTHGDGKWEEMNWLLKENNDHPWLHLGVI